MPRKVSNKRHVAEVVKKLYADAARIDWEQLSGSGKTSQYASWLEDAKVGGVLSGWMSPEETRVWLKDGPMKEYSRALAGIGAFAEYLDDYPRGSCILVKAALGHAWSVVSGSEGAKPLHCDAECDGDIVHLIWGPERDFKHLLWAGLEACDQRSGVTVRIAVFDTLVHPISRGSKAKHTRLGERCGLDVCHVRLAA
jgi:hypothetical protein